MIEACNFTFQVWQQYGFTPEFYYIPQAEAGSNRESYPLRPELIESIMYLYRSTGDPFLLQAGEDILRSIQHSAKTPCGYATIKDVRDHKKEDRMESFFLSETTKYLYLLFDSDNFIHNQGQRGTLIDTVNGECVIDAGGYIFNTEAHPLDPGVLYCCYGASDKNIFNFKEMDRNKAFYRGESIREWKSKNKSLEESTTTTSEIRDEIVSISTESSADYVKLEDNDNVSQKINVAEEEYSQNVTLIVEPENSSFVQTLKDILDEEKKKFDPQQMLEKIRSENKYPRNETWENNYKLLYCKGQPFLQRLSILGEFF